MLVLIFLQNVRSGMVQASPHTQDYCLRRTLVGGMAARRTGLTPEQCDNSPGGDNRGNLFNLLWLCNATVFVLALPSVRLSFSSGLDAGAMDILAKERVHPLRSPSWN
jgi:hypothetical protein